MRRVAVFTAVLLTLLPLGARAGAEVPMMPDIVDLHPGGSTLPDARPEVRGRVAIPAPRTNTGPLDIINFEILTTYRAPDGSEVTRSTDGIVTAPVPVDVDGDLLTGVGGSDVIVQLAIDGRATMRAIVLPGAPSPLPLKIEAILSDPRGATSPLRVAFGYDALADTAPSTYEGTITLIGADRVSSFSLDVRTAAPGDTLGVIAEVFREGPDGSRTDPQRGRVDFTPVPAVAHFGVLQGGDLGIQHSGLDLVTDTPTTVDVLIEDIRGADAMVATARIHRLPNTLTLLLTDSGVGQTNYEYSASDAIDEIDFDVTETSGASVVDQFALRLRGLPNQISVIQDTPTHARVETSSPIGALEAGFAEGGEVRWLAEPAYLNADDSGGVSSLAFRVLGLARAEFDTDDPLVVEATLQAGPLRVRVVDGALAIDAWIRDLPGTFRFEASSTAGTVIYRGSDPIGEIAVNATDPGGIAGRATRLSLVLRDVPTTIDLSYGQSSGAFTLDLGGQTLGLIELQLTTGPDERLDPSLDGVLVRDRTDRYVVFARLTGLRRVHAVTDPVDLQLDTLGGRILRIDMEQQDGPKVEYIRAVLDNLVPSVRVRVVAQGTAERIIYTASQPTNSLTFDTNSGNRWNLNASMANPVPASIEICNASDAACTPGQRAKSGSVSIRTSEHTTINLFDCQAPANSSCPGNPSEFIRVQNLRVRDLDVGNESNGSDEGWLYINTNSRTLSGFAEYRGGSLGARITLPAGFWAQNRTIHWKLKRFLGIPYDIDVSRSGSISCPAGTKFEVQVPVLGWLDVTYEIRILGIRFASGIC